VSAALDETDRFEPSYDAAGLIPAIVTDAGDGRLLMLAYMNAEALRLTLATGKLHFWSRSRQRLWQKGETSGEWLELIEILTDCDQDALQVKARQHGKGAACHTGRRSCFYRRLEYGRLVVIDDRRLSGPYRTP
jgi:phosphoribosyl-AMP cyclohydrolase